jgi:hypothetical protein
MIRCLICVLLLFSASAAYADPILLLLLRMVRDQAISASVEAGVGALQRGATIPSPVYGFALPTPPIPRDSEERHLRALLDDSFLHLSAAQRDVVFAGMRQILNDPRNAQLRPQVVAEFALKARAVRESYLSLDQLSHAEKRTLATRAKAEFQRLPAGERQHLLEVLQSGMLPVPRDLNDIMLAEFSSVPAAAGAARGLD